MWIPRQVTRRERNLMNPTRAMLRATAIGILALGVLTGCEKGPAEKAGERIDNAMDKLSGKGPAEKAGERIDDAARELKK
jgi:hypothetical protein